MHKGTSLRVNNYGFPTNKEGLYVGGKQFDEYPPTDERGMARSMYALVHMIDLDNTLEDGLSSDYYIHPSVYDARSMLPAFTGPSRLRYPFGEDAFPPNNFALIAIYADHLNLRAEQGESFYYSSSPIPADRLSLYSIEYCLDFNVNYYRDRYHAADLMDHYRNMNILTIVNEFTPRVHPFKETSLFSRICAYRLHTDIMPEEEMRYRLYYLYRLGYLNMVYTHPEVDRCNSVEDDSTIYFEISEYGKNSVAIFSY